jgi:hypothetical protein
MATPPVTITDFKAFFNREFVYGSGLDSVQDADITRALNDTLAVFNASLWDSSTVNQAYLYASAHMLVVNIQAAGGLCPVVTNRGTENRSEGVTQNKSVGSISTSYVEIPEWVRKHAGLMPFWETEYGKRYVQMLAPRLKGLIMVVAGEHDPFIAP